MCVLTYIPIGRNGYFFTSNRDESVNRPSAIPPRKYLVNGHCVFYPQDPQSGGTWIGSCGNPSLCLLNGGFEKHIPQPPYRQSRGRVILDYYNFTNTADFFQNYQFDGIEPFTLIIIEGEFDFIVNEIRWDGNQKYHTIYPSDEPRIWSSATLYTDEIIREREKWFADFLIENPEPTSEDVLNFHHFGGKGDVQNDIKMNRNNALMTISICQIQMVSDEEFVIRYQDLRKKRNFSFRIFLESTNVIPQKDQEEIFDKKLNFFEQFVRKLTA